MSGLEIALVANDHRQLHDPVVLDQGRPIPVLIQALDQASRCSAFPEWIQIGHRLEVDVRPQELILAGLGQGRFDLTGAFSPSRLYTQIRLPGSSELGSRDPVPSAGMAREVWSQRRSLDM